MFLKLWVAIVSLESNHEPKFLADDTGVIVAVPTRRLLIHTLASCCDVPLIMNSVLSSFSFNFSLIQHPVQGRCVGFTQIRTCVLEKLVGFFLKKFSVISKSHM